jgi:hypothetical protein
MIYILLISTLILFSFLEVCGLKKQQALQIFAGLSTVLILFAGLRYHTGSDWSTYIRFFNSASNTVHFESGYYILNRMFKWIFNDYYVMQFAITAFVGIVFFKFIIRHSPYPIVTLTLFVALFFSDILMAQVRQSIALAIVVLSTKYIFKRKMIPFLCVIAIASSFHISAIVATPLYFLTKKWSYGLPIVLILGAQAFYFFPEVLLSLVKFITPALPGRLANIATMYANNNAFGQKAMFGAGLFYLVQLGLALWIVIFIRPTDKRMSFFINALTIAVMIKSISTGMDVLYRLQVYYLIFGLIAYTCFRKTTQLRAVYICVLLMLFSGAFIKTRTANHPVPIANNRPAQYQWIPYYNVLCHPPEAKYRKDWNQ